MPKMKTKRAAMKRFKKTGSGKLKRFHANHSHILTKKTRKRLVSRHLKRGRDSPPPPARPRPARPGPDSGPAAPPRAGPRTSARAGVRLRLALQQESDA